MPPQGVGCLCRFGLKTGIDFAQFVLESGVVFIDGPVRTYLLFQLQLSKKEREICEFKVDFKKSFLLLSQSK